MLVDELNGFLDLIAEENLIGLDCRTGIAEDMFEDGPSELMDVKVEENSSGLD